jgi:hypothetical protein
LSKVHLGGEGTRLRREVKKLTVTSHQLCEKFKYIPGQFGVDFLWISVDFGENGVDFGENGQVLTPTDETFQCVRVLLSIRRLLSILVKVGSLSISVDLGSILVKVGSLSISVDLGSILVKFLVCFGGGLCVEFWSGFLLQFWWVYLGRDSGLKVRRGLTKTVVEVLF